MSFKHQVLHRDGSPKVYESPSISGEYLYFTSRTDDIDNKIVGKGPKLFLENTNALEEKHIIGQFLEDIQVKDAYVFWEGATWGDSLTVEVVLPANTPYPSDRGNINIIDGNIVPCTTSQIPDSTWTGTHMYFPIDVSLIRFINEFMLNGSNSVGTVLKSKGVALIKKELQIKMILKSETSNPNLKMGLIVELYRDNTI